MKSVFNRLSILATASALVLAQVIMPVHAAFALDPPAPGNNGTLKVHEYGTTDKTESNKPKVCQFNLEGFGFDANQSGYIKFTVQGNDAPHGTDAGPFSVGPADASGYFASQYFNVPNGATIANGHYDVTMYGKDANNNIDLTDVKAKSKDFKVECGPTIPVPLAPVANATVVPCSDESGVSDKVSVSVTNTNDDTDATVIYTIVLGGQTKTLTLADGATGNVEFGGLAAGSYFATVTGTDGTATTNQVTVKICEITPVPKAPTARIVLVPCTPESGLSDKISVIVTNTDDDTDATITYTVVLNGETKTLTLADGETGNVEFGGLAAGSYSAIITGSDGSVTTDAVTAGVCTVTPPTVCTVSNHDFVQPWEFDGVTYPEAGADTNDTSILPGTYQFVNNDFFTGIHLTTLTTESYVDGLINAGKTPLADIDAMSYTTYRSPSSTGYAGTLPAYILLVDLDGNTADKSDQKYFFYEPYNNGTVAAGIWQTWDAIKGGTAQWWMSGTGQALQNWSTFVTANPNAVAIAYGFNQGTYNAGADTYIKSMTFDCATTTFSAPGKGGVDETPQPQPQPQPETPATPSTPSTPVVPAGKGAVMPTELPETGSSFSPLLIGLLASAAAYGALYFAQPKRYYE